LRKIGRSPKNIPNEGVLGIGTLIVFISVILVAAVASAVIISTSSNIAGAGYLTGFDTRSRVLSRAKVLSVAGTDASDHTLEKFEILIRLQEGGNSFNLNNTIVFVYTKAASRDLFYSGLTTENGEADGNTDYKVFYIKQGPGHVDDIVSQGDVLKVMFTAYGSILEGEKVRIKIVPNPSLPTIVEFTAPFSMITRRINLWP